MRKLFDRVTDTVKQSAQETIAAVKASTKAIEPKREGTNKTIKKIRDLIMYAINFGLTILEPLVDFANSKNTNQYRLRVNPISKTFCIKKGAHFA